MRICKRRLIVFFLSCVLIMNALSLGGYASIESSDYICSGDLYLDQGSTNGELELDFDITGQGTMDTIGVSKIKVYRQDGVLYRTIYGTTANGLLANNTFSHSGLFSISAIAGVTYCCEVTFFAGKDGGYDTTVIFSNYVVAPVVPSP